MIKLAIIPLRSQSKSIKDKNIKMLNQKPLFYYSLNACIKSKLFNQIIISTDSKKYIRLIRKHFKHKIINFHNRSKKNSSDQASTEAVINEVIKNKDTNDKIICFLIQCTSPQITNTDLINAFNYFKKGNYDSLFSSFKKKIFIWKKEKKLKPLNYKFEKRPRRQNFDSLIFENGAFYIFKLGMYKIKKNRLFGKIGSYIMPQTRSFEIDEKEDFSLLKKIMSK